MFFFLLKMYQYINIIEKKNQPNLQPHAVFGKKSINSYIIQFLCMKLRPVTAQYGRQPENGKPS